MCTYKVKIVVQCTNLCYETTRNGLEHCPSDFKTMFDIRTHWNPNGDDMSKIGTSPDFRHPLYVFDNFDGKLLKITYYFKSIVIDKIKYLHIKFVIEFFKK